MRGGEESERVAEVAVGDAPTRPLAPAAASTSTREFPRIGVGTRCSRTAGRSGDGVAFSLRGGEGETIPALVADARGGAVVAVAAAEVPAAAGRSKPTDDIGIVPALGAAAAAAAVVPVGFLGGSKGVRQARAALPVGTGAVGAS